MPRTRALYCAALLSAFAPPTQAVDFCVGTAAQLHGALLVASLNNENDHIQIRQGMYNTADIGAGAQGFVYQTTQNDSLILSGGWVNGKTGGCELPRGGPGFMTTVLNGGDQHRVLDIQLGSTQGHLTLKHLTFIQGLSGPSTGEHGAGVNIRWQDPLAYVGWVHIINNVFWGNRSRFHSALDVAGGDRLVVSNNVFLSNESEDTGAIKLQQSNQTGVWFINNTVFDNRIQNSTPGHLGGARFQVTGTSQLMLANNLFWANDVHDFELLGDGFKYLWHNNFNAATGVAADATLNNLSIAPELGANLEPVAGSALVNAGRLPPPSSGPHPVVPFDANWEVGLLDVLGHPRLWHTQVDIGAVENVSDFIWRSGFDFNPVTLQGETP